MHLKYLAANEVYFLTSSIPDLPVWAFAFPELIINNLQSPLLFFLSQIIGAEGVDVFEYTACTLDKVLKYIIKRSSNFF